MQLSFLPFPSITTKRLLLRQVNDHDKEALFRLRADENVMRFIDRPRAQTVHDASELIQRFRDALHDEIGLTWGISFKEDPALIGTIGYWQIKKEHYRAEIGYLLDPKHQGRGLMNEAIAAVIRYGFETMGLHSIEANVNPLNEASIRLLENNGFVREAYFRENHYWDGRFLDSAIYSLVNSK